MAGIRGKPITISQISISGYKSISKRQSIEIRPLTFLAGANSSGKSSMIQPLLLLKQTFESGYRSEFLNIEGPNVSFDNYDDLLSKEQGKTLNEMKFGFGLSSHYSNPLTEITLVFRKTKKGLQISRNEYKYEKYTISIKRDFNEEEFKKQITPEMLNGIGRYHHSKGIQLDSTKVINYSNFILQSVSLVDAENKFRLASLPAFTEERGLFYAFTNILHIPGLRGNPERQYSIRPIQKGYGGEFLKYVASILHRWKKDKDKDSKLKILGEQLKNLGLTWKVSTQEVSDVSVEIKVGRLPKSQSGGAYDLVNIADVGVGVSQVLPVLVALLVAKPGQIVYIEQPEMHLHPNAQWELARIIADAAKRRVKIVIETHSSILILGIQTLVARLDYDLDPSLVMLHWFTRDPKTGATTITSREMDKAGRLGDWPADFDKISMEAYKTYLDSVEEREARLEI